jgi:glycosyltransferase involved in cell wall biosynthesis
MAFRRDFPEVSQRVVLIPEAYSIEIPPGARWKPKKNPQSILYVGALRKYKNVDKLIHGFKMLVSKSNDLELTIVGEGEQKGELMKLAINLGVENYVAWKSDLTYDELLKEYAEASVVVLLSSLESFSRVAHDAIAIGTPLVIYEYGALGTLANEGLAKGVKNLNPIKIAEAIEAVVENRWERKNLEFPLRGESYVDCIIRLYRNLLGTKENVL